MPENAEVTYNELLQELQKEKDYFSNGGTSYRKRTAILALNVALNASFGSLLSRRCG